MGHPLGILRPVQGPDRLHPRHNGFEVFGTRAGHYREPQRRRFQHVLTTKRDQAATHKCGVPGPEVETHLADGIADQHIHRTCRPIAPPPGSKARGARSLERRLEPLSMTGHPHQHRVQKLGAQQSVNRQHRRVFALAGAHRDPDRRHPSEPLAEGHTLFMAGWQFPVELEIASDPDALSRSPEIKKSPRGTLVLGEQNLQPR